MVDNCEHEIGNVKIDNTMIDMTKNRYQWKKEKRIHYLTFYHMDYALVSKLNSF